MELILVLCLLGIIVALIVMQRKRDADTIKTEIVVSEEAAQAPYKIEPPVAEVVPAPVTEPVATTPPLVVEEAKVETPAPVQKVARPKKVKVVTPVTTDPVIPPKKPRKTSGPRKSASK